MRPSCALRVVLPPLRPHCALLYAPKHTSTAVTSSFANSYTASTRATDLRHNTFTHSLPLPPSLTTPARGDGYLHNSCEELSLSLLTLELPS